MSNKFAIDAYNSMYYFFIYIGHHKPKLIDYSI